MTIFVVDANVAIKWVLPEIHSDAASRLLNDAYSLLAPDFFFPEIGNILWKRVRRGETTKRSQKSEVRSQKSKETLVRGVRPTKIKKLCRDT